MENAERSFEDRVDLKLREAHRQRIVEMSALRYYVDETSILAAKDVEARLEAQSQQLELRWKERMHRTVCEETEAHIPSLEQRLRSSMVAEQARSNLQRKHDESCCNKLAFQEMIPRIEIVVKLVATNEVSASRKHTESLVKQHLNRSLSAFSRLTASDNHLEVRDSNLNDGVDLSEASNVVMTAALSNTQVE
ncbi:hypothetical protein PHYPSEUDO_013183 [Phytophthora pseudosyringae]|uniref:Uncharacterized protein n=1 Tax=Phytophthora pseudosyringae TaxID=221518 RepID=A0A8T1W777_9STRA|nr:hypothetical protein PHYPSEUDO_013183 [Phytophthora pseudosyringae]